MRKRFFLQLKLALVDRIPPHFRLDLSHHHVPQAWSHFNHLFWRWLVNSNDSFLCCIHFSLSSLASWFCKYKQIAEMDNEDGVGVRRNQVRMKFHASFVFSRFTKQHLARELASWEFTSIRMKIICLKSVLIECLSPLSLGAPLALNESVVVH